MNRSRIGTVLSAAMLAACGGAANPTIGNMAPTTDVDSGAPPTREAAAAAAAAPPAPEAGTPPTPDASAAPVTVFDAGSGPDVLTVGDTGPPQAEAAATPDATPEAAAVETCGIPTTGGIPIASNGYVAAGLLPGGMSGFAYAYDDSMPPAGVRPGTSQSCLNSHALCGTITTGAPDTWTWGGGLGVNLNEPNNGRYQPTNVVATGTGITYALTGLPRQGMIMRIDDGGANYLADLPAAAGTIPWSSFHLYGSSYGLIGPPTTITHINFQVPAGPAPYGIWDPFSFCVTSLSFAPGDGGP